MEKQEMNMTGWIRFAAVNVGEISIYLLLFILYFVQ